MILEGLRLMTVGMLTVFAFLALLVGLMNISASFFEANAHRFPEEMPEADGPPGDSQDAEIAVVLAIAEAMKRGQRI